MTDKNNLYKLLSAGLLVLFGAFRMAVMGQTGLGDSESYYFSWSRHIALSYYDHPPVTAWLIRLFTDLGSIDPFYVRLPSLLLYVGCGVLFYAIAMGLFDDARVAFFSILTFNLVPVFAIGALQMVPDVPAAFFYLLFIYLSIPLLENDGPPSRWYLLGVVLGLGLLSKYFDILLLPCIILLCAVVKEYRHWFRRKEPYLMGVVAFLVFMPVIYWNAIHDFPSFRFHLEGRHHGVPFALKNFEQLVAGQMLYMSPVLLGLLFWGIWKSSKAAMVETDRSYMILMSYSLPTIIFFYVICAWTNESEPHWPAFGYLSAIIATSAIGVDGYDRYSAKAVLRLKKAAIAGFVVAGLMFSLFYIHLFHPILPIKPKYDVTNELVGWDKVGKELLRLNAEAASANEKTFLMAGHWLLCSQMLWATKDKIPLGCFNHRMDQFNFWEKENIFYGMDAFVVTDHKFPETPEQRYKLDRSEKIEDIDIKRGGVIVRRFKIFKVYNFKGLITLPR